MAAGTANWQTLVRITARPERGGDVLAYALHTRDIVFDSTTFLALPFEPSQVEQVAGTQVDNAAITHLLGGVFNKANIRGAKWAGAKVEMMAVDLNNLGLGPGRKHVGRIGDVKTMGFQAETQFRGLSQVLNQEQGDRTSKLCRYSTGDEDCGIDIADFSFTSTVVNVHNTQRFTVAFSSPDSYLQYGRVEFTSGANDGLSMEIMDNDGQQVVLFLPMPAPVAIGDTVTLVAGDDKTLATCHSKFGNAINHGGEDCMPNRDDVRKFPE